MTKPFDAMLHIGISQMYTNNEKPSKNYYYVLQKYKSTFSPHYTAEKLVCTRHRLVFGITNVLNMLTISLYCSDKIVLDIPCLKVKIYSILGLVISFNFLTISNKLIASLS